MTKADIQLVRALADKRLLADDAGLGADGLELLYAWYCDGFLLPG